MIVNEQPVLIEGYGLQDRIDTAIARLKAHEPSDGYYLADSGGKDSCVLLRLAEMSGVKFDAHHNLTTVDPPELVRFIKEHHTSTQIQKPKRTMWDLIAKFRMPPTRLIRYCCKELKENGGSGRFVLTGIRKAESVKRSKRRMVETCMTDKTKTYLHPIIDWTEDDVWGFIQREAVPYCSLYNEGFKRIGCILCPMSSKQNKLRDIERYPRYRAAYIRAFARAQQSRIDANLKSVKMGETPEQMFAWWIQSSELRNTKNNTNQILMFEDQ